MKRSRFTAFYISAFAVAAIGLIGTSFVPRAQADASNKLKVVTVSEPIIAGSKVLDPGTYVWKLMESSSDRHTVQIFDKDQRYLEETILAIPSYRLPADGNTGLSLWETPANVP